MDGVIELVSTPAGGSTFTLHVALQRAGATVTKTKPTVKSTATATATAVAAPPVTPPRSRDRRRKSAANVLIVDDHPINRLLLQQQLLYFGCKVTIAASGSEALAHERYFDLILTDLNMPGLDGYALARIWRATGVGCPIIAITAGDSASERERCVAAGINGYLKKPFTMDELEELLGQRIGLHTGPPESPLANGAAHRWQPETMRAAVAALTFDLAELAQCSAACDIDRLGKVVHRIHGGMALLDMRPAVALCRAIEESIAFELAQEALQLTPVLWNMLTQIREDIDPGDPVETTDLE
jgi:two-component system capsular synthesis sensor histidine kinase RcsC